MEPNFVKVFDVLDSGFKNWQFGLFPLLFVAIGIFTLNFPRILKTLNISFIAYDNKRRKIIAYIMIVFASLMFLGSFGGTFYQYIQYKKMLMNGTYQITEGKVENFIPMPYAGHAHETFIVNGVKFSYSDFSVTNGFNNTSSHGGPVKADIFVRISYSPTNNDILRLEIKDYTGPIKDYSKSEPMFPTKEDREKAFPNQPKIPWFANMIFIVVLLDYLGIWKLALPYLKLFIKTRTVNTEALDLPKSIKRDEVTKLANSALYWDTSEKTIWLRPNGLNFLSIPCTTAKWTLDSSSSKITSQQTLISPAPILLMLVIGATAYSLISSELIPPHNPPWFFILIPLFFLFGIWFQTRELSKRMKIISDDAYKTLTNQV